MAAPAVPAGSDSGSTLPRLDNRRMFAVTQSIKPDGIKVDSNGNGESCSAPNNLLCTYNSKLVLIHPDGCQQPQ